jgi:hypothetical protein
LRFAVPALLCAAWTWFAGKDLNWDLLHYHFYLPYALLGGRMSQDYFAAGPQGYLNPLGYLPFYLMVSAGWHSVAVSALLAAVHGLNLTFLYLIARRLVEQRLPAVLAAALGGATAVFWTTAGTSFLDPLLTVPMLGAVLLLLNRGSAQRTRHAVYAGLLFGVAAALKYSNAFFALAALVFIRDRRALAAYIFGGALAVALLAGPWLVVLYREFGNPVFPHLNSVFRSPDFPAISLGAERFAPRELSEALVFPFRLASPEFMTYAEISAPDLRFGLLALALLALVVSMAWRRRQAANISLTNTDIRFVSFFLIAMVAWIWTSGNARYGMLLLLLVGPCFARVVDAAGGARAVRIVLAVALVAQVAAVAMISPPRWFIAERWSREWFPFVVPERATREPVLYLTMEAQTMMAVAPFLHPGSSFVNLRGQHSLAPGWKRIDALIERHEGRVRALGRGLRLQADGNPRPEVIEVYDSTMLRFGFRLDTADCFAIGWQGEDGDTLSRFANALARGLEPRGRLFSLASCALVRAERDPRDIAAEARMSKIFDRIERSCTRLFRGHTAMTEPLGDEWSRTYAGLEARMETHSGRVILAPFFKLIYFDLGMVADWEQAQTALPAACRGS